MLDLAAIGIHVVVSVLVIFATILRRGRPSYVLAIVGAVVIDVPITVVAEALWGDLNPFLWGVFWLPISVLWFLGVAWFVGWAWRFSFGPPRKAEPPSLP